jgi:general secretion pathway protein L
MAHTILGIDLGTWSVKVVELEAGLRRAKLVGIYERPLLPAEEGESHHDRGARTLKALIDEVGLKPEMNATTMGGEAVLRLLSFPWPQKKLIAQALVAELEPLILDDVAEMVTDFVIAETRGAETRVVAVAAPKSELRARVQALANVGAEPRVVGAAALSYAALRARSATQAPLEAPVAFLDIGHRHTHLCVVRGEGVLFARSIPRGAEDVTLALVDSFKMTEPDAERAKHDQAFLLAPGEVATSPAHRRVDEVVRGSVRPLLREIKATLAAYRQAGGEPVVEVVVTGGGARLRGLVPHLAHELGVTVTPLKLRVEEGDAFIDPRLLAFPDSDVLGAALPAQALGLALAAAAPVAQVNLRKGELAYRTDYSYLRGKARALGVGVAAVLIFAGINGYASWSALRKENQALAAALRKASTELFGNPLDAKSVSEQIRGGPKGGAPPIPSVTAFDLFQDISEKMPPADKGKLDVLDLDIKGKVITIKATAESVQQIDAIADAMKGVGCEGTEVEKSKVSSVTAPPSGDNPKGERAELKQFQLTIKTACP